ncbi:MAG: ExbD/TolR family protein [Betaproteobacteria bacterium]
MAFGGFDKGAPEPLAEINMVPLIDVMLVLLVIFIITAPLLTHAVKVDLPKANSTPNITKPDNVQVAIDRSGAVYWNGEIVDQSSWRARMRDAASRQPQPEIHLRADGDVAYRRVAEIMSDAAKHGLTRIGFVTDPDEAR